MAMLGVSWRCCWLGAMAQLLASTSSNTFGAFYMMLSRMATVGKVSAELGMAVCYYDLDGN